MSPVGVQTRVSRLAGELSLCDSPYTSTMVSMSTLWTAWLHSGRSGAVRAYGSCHGSPFPAPGVS